MFAITCLCSITAIADWDDHSKKSSKHSSKHSSKQSMDISSIHIEWLAAENDVFDVPVKLDRPILLVTGHGFGDETLLLATLNDVLINIDIDDAPEDGVFTFILPEAFVTEPGIQNGDYRLALTRYKKQKNKNRRYNHKHKRTRLKIVAETRFDLTLSDVGAIQQIALATETNLNEAAMEAEIFARSSRDNELSALIDTNSAANATLSAAVDQAQNSADNAQTTADSAQQRADGLVIDLGATQALVVIAQATGNSASANALTAQTTANTALSNAAAAQNTGDTALANAATAQTTGNTALANAAAAQNTGDTALTNAATAQTTGNTALANAAAAQLTGDTAVNNAATAQSTADTALTNAATAQGTGDTALANAETAQITGDSALTSAAAAQTTADTALANAATAQSSGDAALLNASTAQATGDTALSNALTAQNTAGTALANAAIAQTTGNTALANAANAQTTGEAAQSTADTAHTRIDLIQLTPGPQGVPGETGIGVAAVTTSNNQDGTFDLHFSLSDGQTLSITTPNLTHPFDTGATLIPGGVSGGAFTTPQQVFLEAQVSWSVSGYQSPEVIAAHWGIRPGVYTELMEVTTLSPTQYVASFDAPSQPGKIYMELIMAESGGGNVSRSGNLTMNIIEALPDAFGDGIDSNFDGFDGDKSKGIFVKSDAAGSTGQYNDPVSLNQAIDIANSDPERNEIYMFSGQYQLGTTWEVEQNLSVYGGFHTDDGNIWLHDDINGFVQAGNESIVNIDPSLETPNGFGHYIGLRSSDLVDELNLGWFQLNVLSAGASGATAQAGQSIVAAYLAGNGESNVYFMDVVTGTASDGLRGSIGTEGIAGGNGGRGSIGNDDSTVPNRTGGLGGVTPGGFNGGQGGRGGEYHVQPDASEAGFGPSGGQGGEAGISSRGRISAVDFYCGVGSAGARGQVGGAGNIGAALAQVQSPIGFTNGFYEPITGSVGTLGEAGSGGGGGGGGGGQGSTTACNDGTGNSGGGGGGGGLPGTGGTGGYGGGANIGFVILGTSSGNIPQAQVNYSLGNVGVGGLGGYGGSGGRGGVGGDGPVYQTDEVGAGGNGGYGGQGGRGGQGQQGADGLQKHYLIVQ